MTQPRLKVGRRILNEEDGEQWRILHVEWCNPGPYGKEWPGDWFYRLLRADGRIIDIYETHLLNGYLTDYGREKLPGPGWQSMAQKLEALALLRVIARTSYPARW